MSQKGKLDSAHTRNKAVKNDRHKQSLQSTNQSDNPANPTDLHNPIFDQKSDQSELNQTIPTETNSPSQYQSNSDNLTNNSTEIDELQAKIKQLEKEIESARVKNFTLQQELDDWKEKSLRIGAEISNLQKQHELETSQIQKLVKKNLVLQLLEFLNTLNLSFSYVPQTDDDRINHFVKTLEISFNRLLADLKNNQVEILLAKPGDEFNPEFMTILNGPENVEGKAVVKQMVTLGLKVDGQIIQPVSVLI
jgi:molecular chaperone GrpE